MLALPLPPSFSDVSKSALGCQGRKDETPQIVMKDLQERIMHLLFLQAV